MSGSVVVSVGMGFSDWYDLCGGVCETLAGVQ